VDVYPTLADLCGLPKPDTDGVSLKPIMENPSVTVKQVAISQYPKSAGVSDKKGAKGTAKRDVMGYSIRDDRWRLTLWRSLADNKIVDTELYDEVNAPTEPENLAKKPENQEVIARLSKFLPPPIPAADPNAKKIAKGKKNMVDIAAKKKDEDVTAPSITAPKTEETKERGPMFDRRDVNKDGKLSREEFMDKQKDPAHAAENFIKFDKDKDGSLTKEEFVKSGK
jgi:iduronate 2-sulfatase